MFRNLCSLFYFITYVHLSRECHRSSVASTDGSVDKQALLNNKDQRQADISSSGGTMPELRDHKRTDYMSE